MVRFYTKNHKTEGVDYTGDADKPEKLIKFILNFMDLPVVATHSDSEIRTDDL